MIFHDLNENWWFSWFWIKNWWFSRIFHDFQWKINDFEWRIDDFQWFFINLNEKCPYWPWCALRLSSTRKDPVLSSVRFVFCIYLTGGIHTMPVWSRPIGWGLYENGDTCEQVFLKSFWIAPGFVVDILGGFWVLLHPPRISGVFSYAVLSRRLTLHLCPYRPCWALLLSSSRSDPVL